MAQGHGLEFCSLRRWDKSSLLGDTVNIQMTCGTAGALELRRAGVIQGDEQGEDPIGMSMALDRCSSLISVAIIKTIPPKQLRKKGFI